MNRLQQFLHRKRLAYLRTFCGDGDAPHGEGRRVLADLKRFCGINRGGIVVSPITRTVDPYASAYRAGLRDAYLRIAAFLDLDESSSFEEHINEPENDSAARGG